MALDVQQFCLQEFFTSQINSDMNKVGSLEAFSFCLSLMAFHALSLKALKLSIFSQEFLD